jgi:hypothetical protein
MVEIEAVSSMCPCRPAGSPSSCAIQSSTRSSSSVAAGPVCQTIVLTLRAAAMNSASTAGSEPLVEKYAKNRG